MMHPTVSGLFAMNLALAALLGVGPALAQDGFDDLHLNGRVVLAAAPATVAPAAPSGARLPERVSEPAELVKTPSPTGDRSTFFLMEPGKPATVGVASADGQIAWQRAAGIRPLVSQSWSQDGRLVAFVTDCAQPEAQLRNPKKETASWLFVLDAHTGDVVAQGDLDTDVLDLPRQLPDATGAAHMIDKLTIVDGIVAVTISHRGQKVSGQRKLTELASSR